MYDILQLSEMLVPELKELAKSLGLKGINRLTKQELIYKILDHQAITAGGSDDSGDSGKQESKNQQSKEKADSKSRPQNKPKTRKTTNIDKKAEEDK